jgi:hypothetical protein
MPRLSPIAVDTNVLFDLAQEVEVIIDCLPLENRQHVLLLTRSVLLFVLLSGLELRPVSKE